VPFSCLALVVAVMGCGGGASAPDRHTTTTATTSPQTEGTSTQGLRPLRHDTSRTAAGIHSDHTVCRLMGAREVASTVAAVTARTPRLQAHPNDSFELSVCRYSGGGTVVRVVLDGAADATRRFFNMLTEANELPILLHGRNNFRLVWDVGDDHTYGGAGAYWIRSRHQIIAIHADRIARVAVVVPGAGDRQRRIVASRLARRVLARAAR
jgi:hypothetical protein